MTKICDSKCVPHKKLMKREKALEKKRKPRRWFSEKYDAWLMNIRDFFTDNLGREFQELI